MTAENFLHELPGVNEQLAELQIIKTGYRKRKPNFSVQEIAIITQKFEQNQAILKSKFTKTNTVEPVTLWVTAVTAVAE